MTEYRFKSRDPNDLAITPQVLVLDRAWGLSLNDGAPVDKNAREMSIAVDHGDQLVIGVDTSAMPLSGFSVSVIDPEGNAHVLANAWTTDGEPVEAEQNGNTKVLNIKIVIKDDLPD